MVEIKTRNGETIYSYDGPQTLRGANLSGMFLAEADLRLADLRGADLQGANLRFVDLRGADLRKADLQGTDLWGADLTGADLRGTNLCLANLRGADLQGADLQNADLSNARLRDADFTGANLTGANLANANVKGAKGLDEANDQRSILPEGDLVGWKRGRGGEIIALRIPADAKRSHAFGRKCRAEYAEVLEITDELGHSVKAAWSQHDYDFIYVVGQTVYPDSFDPDWRNGCAPGIHFFITRAEAEDY